MDRNQYEKRRELINIDRELMNLEEAIAVLGRKEDIDYYYELLNRRDQLKREIADF